MPQPKVTPEAPAPTAPDNGAESEAAAQEWADLVARVTAGDSSAAKQIGRAISLEKERAELMKRIGDNRDYLRLMDKNEELNEDEADFLDTFYPEKERGQRREKADIEATRKAREAARKDGSAA